MPGAPPALLALLLWKMALSLLAPRTAVAERAVAGQRTMNDSAIGHKSLNMHPILPRNEAGYCGGSAARRLERASQLIGSYGADEIDGALLPVLWRRRIKMWTAFWALHP